MFEGSGKCERPDRAFHIHQRPFRRPTQILRPALQRDQQLDRTYLCRPFRRAGDGVWATLRGSVRCNPHRLSGKVLEGMTADVDGEETLSRRSGIDLRQRNGQHDLKSMRDGARRCWRCETCEDVTGAKRADVLNDGAVPRRAWRLRP